MPDLGPSRKPPKRFWLFAPYVALLIGVVVWSGVWLGMRAMIERRMDATAERLRGEGYVLDWKSRVIDGYPFRLDVTLEQPRLIEPSGWGLTAPTLKGQTFPYALGHWVVVAYQGVALRRPQGGAVTIAGQALRASVAGFENYPPRVSIEGVGLRFTPAPGAALFPVTYAAKLGLHMRPFGDDGAEGYLMLEGAQAPVEGLLGRLSGGHGFALISDLTASHARAFSGRDWPGAARAWASAGGAVDLVRTGLAAGPLRIGVGRGALSLDKDGRLQGAMAVDFAAGGAGQTPLIDLTFEGGRASLGPVPVGPAPKLY